MCSFVQAAFWMSVVASTALMIGYVIPFWLAEVLDSQNKTYWGLWYRVVCSRGNCSSLSGAMNKGQVHVAGDLTFDLLMIPILSSVGFGLTFLAVILLEVVNCRCCGPRCNPHGIISICAVLFLVAGLVIVADMVLCILGLDSLFSGKDLEKAEEFPWSVFLFIVGGIFDFIAAGMYIAISCNWEKYAPSFGFDPLHYETENDGVSGQYNRRSRLQSDSSKGKYRDSTSSSVFGKNADDLRKSTTSARDLRTSKQSERQYAGFNSSTKDPADNSFFSFSVPRSSQKETMPPPASSKLNDSRDLRYSQTSNNSKKSNDYTDFLNSSRRVDDDNNSGFWSSGGSDFLHRGSTNRY